MVVHFWQFLDRRWRPGGTDVALRATTEAAATAAVAEVAVPRRATTEATDRRRRRLRRAGDGGTLWVCKYAGACREDAIGVCVLSE